MLFCERFGNRRFSKCFFSTCFLSFSLLQHFNSSAHNEAFGQSDSSEKSSVPTSDLGATPSGKSGEIYIDVGNAQVRKLKLALLDFQFTLGNVAKLSPADIEKTHDYLGDVLGFTGFFEFVPKSSFSNSSSPDPGIINFEEWKPSGSELLIQGNFSGDKGTSLEMRLFDMRTKKLLLGKRFTNVSKGQLTAIVRRFADLCIEVLTGEKGIFSSKIAFAASETPGAPKQIYIANFDGTNAVNISNNTSINMSPSWSPDGEKITYTSFKEGRPHVYLYNTFSRKTIKLTHTGSGNSGANWNPSGKKIAFISMMKGNTAIFTMSSFDGSAKELLISGSGLEVEPAFAPDGKKLAFVSGRFGNPHLFVRDLDTNKDDRITYAGWYNSSPSWRPDGKKLAFAGFDKEINRYDLFIVNPDGRQMERLTLDQGDNEKPSWSPDGRFLLFQSNRAETGKGKQKSYKLYTMNKDGGEVKVLKLPFAEVSMPSWSPRRLSWE